MRKRFAFAFAASLVLMCGCTDKSGSEENTETASETVIASALTETSVTSESTTVICAKTEPTVTETEPPQTETPELKENQLEFRSINIAVLMEFTGAEPLNYYPNAVKLAKYSEDDYVLHAVFTVENLTYESFDFIPQKMILHGRDYGSSFVMQPITENDTGLVSSDGFYTIEPDESVSFKIDFVGDRKCIKYADKISYNPDMHFYTNNIDADGLNNVSVASVVEIEDRITVRNAVQKALEITENEPLPFQFVPSDGDCQINTEKNSYCFTVEKVRPEGYVIDYIRIKLKIASLTGKADTFEPNGFKLVSSDGKSDVPLYWSFDESLVQTPKINKEITVNGENVTLYDYPFGLYLNPDGTAEYDIYFRYKEGKDYESFNYEGKNDSFCERIETE